MESMGTSARVRNLMHTEEKYFEKEILLIYKKLVNNHTQTALQYIVSTHQIPALTISVFEMLFFNRQSKAAWFLRRVWIFFFLNHWALNISYCSGKGKMHGKQPKLNNLTPFTRSGTQRKKIGTNMCVVYIYLYVSIFKSLFI